MGKRAWVISVVLGIVLVTGGLASLVRAANARSTSYHVNLTGKVVDEAMGRFDSSSKRHFGLGAKDFNRATPHLEMDLSFAASGDAMVVSGSGVIRVGKKTFPISVDPGSTVNVAKTGTGSLYVGSFHSTVRTEAGDTVTGTMLVVDPVKGQATYNVAVGELGQEVLVAFGRPFYTQQDLLAPTPAN